MVVCSVCNAENADSSQFCSACGTRLALAGEPTMTCSAEPAQPQHVGSSSHGSGSSLHGRFLPGTLLGRRYRIVSLTGRGAMGEVYRADDLRLGVTVALKFLPREVVADPRRYAYLVNEVRLARQVSHPNVCRVYDLDEVDGAHFLSMEYVDGEDIRTLLKRIGRLPKDKALELARQLFSGLCAAHERGVIHRDLKPSNIMIDGRGQLKISDFGLARAAEDMSTQAEIVGTPAYMAPEQLLQGQTSLQSDIYSAGLIVYEILTGKPACSGRSYDEVRRQYAVGSSISPPSSVVGEVDPAAEQVVMRCLEKEPARRPASTAAVLAALPGGDLLQATLAAGETPTPEMVAAAGGRTGLSRQAAVICLAMVASGLLVCCLLLQQTLLVNQVAVRDTAELKLAAEHWIDQCLQLDTFENCDEAHGFTISGDRFAPVRYWYRRRNGPLVPSANWSSEVGWQASFGHVELDAPPRDIPGEICVEFDGAGHLVRYEKTPPLTFTSDDVGESGSRARANGGQASQNWEAWFPEQIVGFRFQDLGTLERRKGLPLPQHPDCAVQTWMLKGDKPKHDRYVLAAAYHSELVYFETGLLDKERAYPSSFDFLHFLLFAILPVAVLLAWRHLLIGRIDRRTVTCVATIMFVCGMAVYMLSANHQFGMLESKLLTLALETTAAVVANFFIFYCSLEPLVRKMWPATLITWTRLFAGEVRDPLVGRDLLLGTAFGVLHMALFQIGIAIPIWTGDNPPLFAGLGDPLMGVRECISTVLLTLLMAFQLCSLCLAILAILRHVLRYENVAILAVGALNTFGLVIIPSSSLPPESWIPEAIAIFVAWSLFGFVIVRFGFLTFFVAWMTVVILEFLPMTTNFGAPYFDSALVGILLILGVAVWGFDITLGGRPRHIALRWIRGR